MPARVEFIPYGSNWKPETTDVEPGNQWKGLRKPKSDTQTTFMGATFIDLACEPSDQFSTFSFVGPDEKSWTGKVGPDDDPVVIHRGSPSDDPRRGTIRISHHRANFEDDNEVISVPEPDPTLKAGAEVELPVSQT